MISLANCNRLNDRNVIDHEKTDQFAFVHYLDEQMDLVVKLKMTDQLRTCDLLQHAVQHFKLNDTHFESSHSNSFSVHDSSTYQLISLGSYRFEPGAIITQRNRFFVPTNRNLHFCLLPKRISINLLLNFDTQHRGTSSIETPSQNKWLSIQINPIASVADLKQHVCQLFSVDWSRCWISFRFVQLADHYSLFTVGISNNDHLIVHRV